MTKSKKQKGVLSVRDFPVEVRELLYKVADHLHVKRGDFLAQLIDQEIGHFATTFAAIDKQMDGINQWWKSRSKVDKSQSPKKDVE